MTRSPHTRRIDTRSLALAVTLLAVLAPVAGVATVGTAGAQSTPALAVGNASTTTDATATVDVTLTSVPDGLSGYNVTLRLDGDADATITDVSADGAYAPTSHAVADDARSAWVQGVDTEHRVEPGATDVRLATVTVQGESAGDVEIVAEPSPVSGVQDEDGARIDPASGSGTVTVTAPEEETESGGSGGGAGSSGGGGGGGGVATTTSTTTSTTSTTSSTTTSTTTATSTSTTASTTSETSADTTMSETSTNTTTAETSASTTSSTTSSGSSPGVGVVGALLALAGVGALARRD